MSAERRMPARRRGPGVLLIAAFVNGVAGQAAAQMPDMMDDDFRTMIMADELELAPGSDGRALSWRADAWTGTDLHKLWLRTEGERADGRTDESELELLYSRALLPFWDLQAGIRHEARPSPDRSSVLIGVQGLAPYWFEVEASLAIGEGGQRRLHALANYDLLLTQRLILEPEAELTVHARSDADRLIGPGPNTFEVGLRLRYEIRREFAPYIGIVRRVWLGRTADRLEALGSDTDETELVVGIRVWY